MPLHASCKIDWEFSASCEEIQSKIVDQINQWDVSSELQESEMDFIRIFMFRLKFVQ